MSLKYSLIIPTLNEEFYLEDTLQSLEGFKSYEIIISDGGSTDGTLKIAERYNAKIINSEPGRGIQLNNGIKNSSGEILCFLHGDTLLPVNAFNLLEDFFAESKHQICRFKLGFDVEHTLLNLYKRFSKYDTLFTRFGDTFIAVRRSFNEEIGGFPNWKNFEDVEYLRKAPSKNKVHVLDGEVVSSSRTFLKHGLVAQQLFSIYYFIKYLFGARKFIDENKYYNRKMKSKAASIILFVKYPTEGKVKTRLAETIGNKKALKIYTLLAEKIVTDIKRLRNTYNYIFYSEEEEKNKVQTWIKGNFFYAAQKGKNLGERMSNAFRLVFGHAAKKVLILGTDIPGISTAIINEAIKKLDDYNVVIGPSPDGGYYLLGLNKFTPELFENITYSTSTVLVETIKKIEDMQLTYFTLDEKADIDTEKELTNWLQEQDKNNLKQKIHEVYSQNF